MITIRLMASKKPSPYKFLPHFLAVILLLLFITLYQASFKERFFPGVAIGDSDVSFMSREQAYQLLISKLDQRAKNTLEFSYSEHSFPVKLAETNISFNYSDSLDQAFALGHSGPILERLFSQAQALFLKKVVLPQIEVKADEQIRPINKTLDKDPVDATLWLDEVKQIHISEGSTGVAVNTELLAEEIKKYLSFGIYHKELQVVELEPDFTASEAQTAKASLEKVKNQPLELSHDEDKWTIDLPTLYYLLNLTDGTTLLDSQKLDRYIQEITAAINHPVQEPLFKFDTTQKRVTAFRPARVGVEMDQVATKALILAALQTAGSPNITIPTATIEPKIKTDAANNLGIKELIGRGVSNFAGSIPNRIFNIGLTASRLNGVLIPPGQVFSFNATVGEISSATGFKPAFVIKEGRTVLDDGGGVCQDSTTLFRAVLNAGLPVVGRTAHAYRVGYYEQGFPPGLDATVFFPSVDFKFKNDAQSHILIQSYISGTTLFVDLYGTPDGREVNLTTPVITNQTPPPPELRQDDPSLPKGTVKQVDFPAWGANVTFSRTVTRGGETLIKESFRSNYKAWQAVYLVGTKE